MASQAVRLPSPARALFQGSRSMRPILKRPTPLPLSPAAPTANFSSLLSPSLRVLNPSAARVRFPSSPTQLVATINTYASDSYDRVPISISPNPVSMPGWGERVYSPSTEGFRLASAPKVFRSLSVAYQPSPVMAEFEDPRSPRVRPTADVTGAKAANAIRFGKLAATQGTTPARITLHPRTPYPTATHESDAEMESKGRLENNRNKHGLMLNRPIGSDFVASPLSQSFGGIHTSSINRPRKPAPLPLESHSTDSDKLSNAFWNSVSLESESANAPMVTALEYPESAIEYEEKMDIGIRSACQPPLMFAGADGVLFSPGLPRPHARVERLRESIQQVMSPAVERSTSAPIARKEVTAPSPNDPFAAFPSFGAVLQQVSMDSTIQYPAAVAQKD